LEDVLLLIKDKDRIQGMNESVIGNLSFATERNCCSDKPQYQSIKSMRKIKESGFDSKDTKYSVHLNKEKKMK
jgi:hypothetical protein